MSAGPMYSPIIEQFRHPIQICGKSQRVWSLAKIGYSVEHIGLKVTHYHTNLIRLLIRPSSIRLSDGKLIRSIH